MMHFCFGLLIFILPFYIEALGNPVSLSAHRKFGSLLLLKSTIEVSEFDPKSTFWAPQQFVLQSKRAENRFIDITAENLSIVNIFVVPKSTFSKFVSENVTTTTQEIMSILGQPLSTFPAPSGSCKLLALPLNSSGQKTDIASWNSINVLFYDDITVSPISPRFKVFDSAWSSTIFREIEGNKTINNCNVEGFPDFTSFNFLYANFSQLPPSIADDLCLSFALHSYK